MMSTFGRNTGSQNTGSRNTSGSTAQVPGTAASSMSSSTMTSQPLTKQALYNRIRASSKDEVIVDEMVRLGFWPGGQNLPQDPALDIRRRAMLEKELRALRTEQGRLYDEEKLIAAMRKQRMVKSKEGQQETKQRHEATRQAKAAAWAARKENEILYLGPEHSWGLSVGGALALTQEEKLKRNGLPILTSVKELAAFLDVDLATLRFFCFERAVSRVHHYQRFEVAKKTGGVRNISAPMPRLKKVQRIIVDRMLSEVELHDAAHGFRAAHSIVSNAAPHQQKSVVINLDLQNFFPTITFRRIRGLFKALGYNMSVSTVLGLLCTELPVHEVQLDGETYFVKKGERVLPQGSPCSPALTNLLCRRLDHNLMRIAVEGGFAYTRYADDLTFSTSEGSADISGLLNSVAGKVKAEGFRLHPDKTRIMRAGRQQEVTGIVVNDKLGVDRKTLRKFRAFLFQLKKKGPKHVTWGNGDDVFSSAMGFARFVMMVDRAKGQSFCAEVYEAMRLHNYVVPKTPFRRKDAALSPSTTSSVAQGDIPDPGAVGPISKSIETDTNGDSGDATKPWWKIF